MSDAPPSFTRVVETAIYADDLQAAESFYCGVIGLRRVGREEGRHLFLAAGSSMLLVFRADATLRGDPLPAHGARGPGHFALEVTSAVDLARWRTHLEGHGVAIEHEAQWAGASLRSIYFRDPAGNSVEIIMRGAWPV